MSASYRLLGPSSEASRAATVRDGVSALVSKLVWQPPDFQALDRSRLFPRRGRLGFLANADSQPLLFTFPLTPNAQPQAEGQRVDPGCSRARKIDLDPQKTERSAQKVTELFQFLFGFGNLSEEEGGG